MFKLVNGTGWVSEARRMGRRCRCVYLCRYRCHCWQRMNRKTSDNFSLGKSRNRYSGRTHRFHRHRHTHSINVRCWFIWFERLGRQGRKGTENCLKCVCCVRRRVHSFADHRPPYLEKSNQIRFIGTTLQTIEGVMLRAWSMCVCRK